MEKEFSASMDNVAKIVTSLVTPILLIMPSVLYFSLRTQADQNGKVALLVFVFLLPILFFLAYALAPKKYIVTPTSLICIKNFGKKIYSKSAIKNIQSITKTEMGFAIRLFASGGVFGYFGTFYSSKMGKMIWHCTQRENLVLVEMQNGSKIIVSPDDVKGFVGAF